MQECVRHQAREKFPLSTGPLLVSQVEDKGGGKGGKRKNAADAKALEIEYLEGELEALAEKEREEVGSIYTPLFTCLRALLSSDWNLQASSNQQGLLDYTMHPMVSILFDETAKTCCSEDASDSYSVEKSCVCALPHFYLEMA